MERSVRVALVGGTPTSEEKSGGVWGGFFLPISLITVVTEHQIARWIVFPFGSKNRPGPIPTEYPMAFSSAPESVNDELMNGGPMYPVKKAVC